MTAKIWYIVKDTQYQELKRVWIGTRRDEANKELIRLKKENMSNRTIYWVDFEWK